uniref:Uncharacterized protein n=1 Tax=Eutreptiella gymnastica TaxID=73025 RepID=A0A7S1NJH9_9EUGL|mmetsp:Transcript_45158/g.80755  ORF Transcript_45158/g.80755 Transcript_45158/m.80755 type:complete len:299 (+) Transcript_45158:117-1013(+)
MDPQKTERIIKEFGGTPHFALMSYKEFTGSDLMDCELVAEVYFRRVVKERKAKFLWMELEQVLNGKYDYALQVTHFNKCRVGLRTKEDLETFRKSTLLELMAGGITVKDERSQEFLTPYVADEEVESEASLSEAMSENEGESAVVLYDVPPVYDAQAVKGMLTPTMDISRVERVYWTPGDAALAAWRIQGKGAAAMDGTLLTDATGDTRMSILSMRKYAQKKREQKQSQARNREERKDQSGRSYVDMASMRAPRVSLLGPQHGYYPQQPMAQVAASQNQWQTVGRANQVFGKGRGKGQ